MNIEEMKISYIKDNLNAMHVSYIWNTKSEKRGNFCICIFGVKGAQGEDFELSGQYNKDGEVFKLYFGYLYRGCPMQIGIGKVEEMITEIKQVTKRRKE